MSRKRVENTDNGHVEESSEGEKPLDKFEVEVRLAIADFVIRRVAGTPAAQEIFERLIRRFEGRYPQHKLLAHYLTSPDSIEPDFSEHQAAAAPCQLNAS